MADVREYRLNEDYRIECVLGNPMSVRVIMVSLPWEPVIEEYTGIVDKDEANQIFKRMVSKYRFGVYESVFI